MNKKNGFTLIEILISTVILVLITGVFYGLYSTTNDIWEERRVSSELQSMGRRCIERISAELKSATRSSGAVPSPNVVISGLPFNTNLTFYLPADIDGDGLLTDASGDLEWDTSNPIRYLYDSSQNILLRSENATNTTLARQVADVRFFDANLNASLYLTEIRLALTLAKSTIKQRNITTTMVSNIRLRN